MTPARLLRATTLALAVASPAAAFDPGAMTPAEKDAFGTAVRAYLMENPQVLMEAIDVLQQQQYKQQVQDDVSLLRDNHAAIFDDRYSWVGANPTGDVTIVEFVDYRCTYCRKANPEVEELVKSDGNIRFVLKELPILGEGSLASSKFAIAVQQIGGQEAYKKAHDELIALRGEPNAATLGKLAEKLGLNAKQVLAQMDSPEVLKVIDTNHALAEKLQIEGTPMFIIGNKMVRGYLPLDGMRDIVARARKG